MLSPSIASSVAEELAPLRDRVVHHPVFERLDNRESLRVFMEHHVFAVWDFMSLVVALQFRLTCVSVPWVPLDANLARLVNEVKTAEESDVDPPGGRYISHLDLYRRAMREVGASTDAIDRAIHATRTAMHPMSAVRQSGGPPGAVRFTERTMAVALSGDALRIASAFAFGREQLIPAMFERVLRSPDVGGSTFHYYLQRHVTLDGDEHGPAAERLVDALCRSDDDRGYVLVCAREALYARLDLWDSIETVLL